MRNDLNFVRYHGLYIGQPVVRKSWLQGRWNRLKRWGIKILEL